MTLFDSIPRTELRPRFDSESAFEYDNISARPGVAAWREVAEGWFAQYPDEHKPDLRGRFRSPSDSDHYAAFFELYLHQLLKQIGCTVTVHPELNGTTSRPDFLITTANGGRCYIEAVLACCPSEQAEAAGRRAARVYDCINEMNSPNFFVGVHVRGAPGSSPSGVRLRRDLENWLATLDPDSVAALFTQGRDDEVPRYSWSHDGWEIEFEPLPKSPANRGKPGVRPIGIRVPEMRWMDSAPQIREAVKRKARKYGRLEEPLIVCVDVLDWIHPDFVLDALLGDVNGGRRHNGVFGSEENPRTRRVSAVVVARDLVPFTMGTTDPELFHHPWPYNKLGVDFWPITQWIANREKRTLEKMVGVQARKILGLPEPWPVSLD